MTARLGFYFDADRCIGCGSCESACREWNGLELGTRWRQVVRRVIGVYPDVSALNVSMACNNCVDAPCVRACPTGAMYRDGEMNLVQLDPQTCIGCRYCEWACPYGAIQYHAETKKVSKCTLCSDRLQASIAPACVTSCPTKCLVFGEIDRFAAKHPSSSPDFDGLPKSEYATPNLLMEPTRRARSKSGS